MIHWGWLNFALLVGILIGWKAAWYTVWKETQ